MDLENDVKRATEDFPDTVERLPPLNYSSAAPSKSRIPVPIREKPPSPGPGRFEGTYSNYKIISFWQNKKTIIVFGLVFLYLCA